MDELMDTQESQKVYVVGGQHLQNALLTEFLDKASITASAVKSVDQVHEDDLRAVEQNLFLVDFHSVDVNDVITRLLETDKRLDSEILIGVFNVDDDDDLSRLAGLPMVNGGFQHDCPQALSLIHI